MKHKKHFWTQCTSLTITIQTYIRQGVRALKACIHTVARGIRQPSLQYRAALVLTVLLAGFIWWALFRSLFTHSTLLAFAGDIQ